MKKILLSLMLVTAMTCTKMTDGVYRCENDEVVCYVFKEFKTGGGISCKFKEQE